MNTEIQQQNSNLKVVSENVDHMDDKLVMTTRRIRGIWVLQCIFLCCIVLCVLCTCVTDSIHRLILFHSKSWDSQTLRRCPSPVPVIPYLWKTKGIADRENPTWHQVSGIGYCQVSVRYQVLGIRYLFSHFPDFSFVSRYPAQGHDVHVGRRNWKMSFCEYE